MTRPVTCGHDRPHHADGQCARCYGLRYRPRTGNPGGHGVHKTRDDIDGRLEDLAELLRRETDRLVIARRLGISYRTLDRYQARLRERAA